MKLRARGRAVEVVKLAGDPRKWMRHEPCMRSASHHLSKQKHVQGWEFLTRLRSVTGKEISLGLISHLPSNTSSHDAISMVSFNY